MERIERLAVASAVQAPSVHNTQPWRFAIAGREISLHADPRRRLAVADPDGREMLISCGAALFNLRVALRHLGYQAQVTLGPEPRQPGLLAQVRVGGSSPATEYEEQLFAQIERRRTHRDAFLSESLPPGLLTLLCEEAAREATLLCLADDDDKRAALAAAVTAAEHAGRLDRARTEELAKWARPPGSPARDGIPSTAYPARPQHSEPDFPGRDFAHGRGWGLPPSMMAPLHRSPGAPAVLATSVDAPVDWIRSGQALQRVLLTASVYGIAAALHSQPLELPELREFIRVRLSVRAYPQMLLRFGATDEAPATVRRPVEQVLL